MMRKIHWKTAINAVFWNFMIAVITFIVLTKPFLAEGKSQYVMIEVYLNAFILAAFGIGIGKRLAMNYLHTAPSATYKEGMTLKNFIWTRHGLQLVILLSLWLICLFNPEILHRPSELLSLGAQYDVSFGDPYTVSVWKQFIIYRVFSISSITAWVMCYITFVFWKDKLQFEDAKKTLAGL